MRALTHTWIHASATTLLALVIVALAVPPVSPCQILCNAVCAKTAGQTRSAVRTKNNVFETHAS